MIVAETAVLAALLLMTLPGAVVVPVVIPETAGLVVRTEPERVVLVVEAVELVPVVLTVQTEPQLPVAVLAYKVPVLLVLAEHLHNRVVVDPVELLVLQTQPPVALEILGAYTVVAEADNQMIRKLLLVVTEAAAQ